MREVIREKTLGGDWKDSRESLGILEKRKALLGDKFSRALQERTL